MPERIQPLPAPASVGPATWSTQVLRADDGLADLRQDWDDLVSRCRAATPFQAYAWLRSWWGSYGAAGRAAAGSRAPRRPAGRRGPADADPARGMPGPRPVGDTVHRLHRRPGGRRRSRRGDATAGHGAARRAGLAGGRPTGGTAGSRGRTPDCGRHGRAADGRCPARSAWSCRRPRCRSWSVTCRRTAARPSGVGSTSSTGPDSTSGRSCPPMPAGRSSDLLRLHALQWRGRGGNPAHLRAEFRDFLGGAAAGMIALGQAALYEYRLDGAAGGLVARAARPPSRRRLPLRRRSGPA